MTGLCACFRERDSQNVCQTRLIKLFIVNMLKQCESVVFKELINPRKYVKGRADVEGDRELRGFPDFSVPASFFRLLSRNAGPSPAPPDICSG